MSNKEHPTQDQGKQCNYHTGRQRKNPGYHIQKRLPQQGTHFPSKQQFPNNPKKPYQ